MVSIQFMRHALGDIYIAQGDNEFVTLQLNGNMRSFIPTSALQYIPFCDDFGPLNMACIAEFITLLDDETESFPGSKIVFCVEPGKRKLTNAVFLLGAYMILKLDSTACAVAQHFSWLDSTLIEPYRDATHSRPDFHLHLLDCWRGLEKGKALGWVHYTPSSYMWGKIDMDIYKHYDNPINGHLHMVVPDKLIAFQGPEDLGQLRYLDDDRGRVLSPTFYAGALRDLGATTVIRLNEARYDANDFEKYGLQHIDLPFPDCTSPSWPVVSSPSTPRRAPWGCTAGPG